RKEINSIKETFKNNNNRKGLQHKPNKLPIVNDNNKRAKPDSSSSENDDNNLVLNLESKVEKQDSLLTNMFNMITKLTGQLSDKEQQHDTTTKEFASIGGTSNSANQKKNQKKKTITIPNQINDNIDMFNNEHINQKYFTKIAVLNVCTLTEYKLNNIFDYIRKNGIDIMGITETQKADKEINFFNADKAGYKIISHNDNKNAIGKGVMLIIRNNLEKHIFNIKKINGRILIVDFSFKNNKKLRLILFYNLANHRTGVDMNKKIDMNTHVIKQIKNAKSHKMEIICCGDFNLQYQDLNLWDVHKETYDMDNTKEIMTYFGRFNSRIDYIWISENLFTKTSKAKIINIRDIINTDHALLTFDFINEDLIYPILQAKKMNTINTNLIRHIFDFDNTEEKDFLNFQDDLKKVASSFNLNVSIEEKWSFFKNNLLKIKQQHIRSKEIIINIDRNKTFKHTQLYKDLRYIVYLRRKFKKKLSFEKLALNWKHYNNYLKHLVKRHSIDDVNSTYLLLQHRLSQFLIGQYVKELNEIYDTLFSKFSLEMFNLKNEKIKEAIDKCCADLADNQRRMIDNITENEMKKIFIDR
ncbi:9171_t:CDS:2, partial [Rhizophagus irregularis]